MRARFATAAPRNPTAAMTPTSNMMEFGSTVQSRLPFGGESAVRADSLVSRGIAGSHPGLCIGAQATKAYCQDGILIPLRGAGGPWTGELITARPIRDSMAEAWHAVGIEVPGRDRPGRHCECGSTYQKLDH